MFLQASLLPEDELLELLLGSWALPSSPLSPDEQENVNVKASPKATASTSFVSLLLIFGSPLFEVG
jgi:hypothetical protein